MDTQEKDSHIEKMNELNTKMVDLHCDLISKNLSIDELRDLQDRLNSLAICYHMFEMTFHGEVDSLKKDLTEKRDKHSRRSKYFTAFAIIPGIGLLLAVYLVLHNYNITLEAKLELKSLEDIENEIDANLSIMERMLNSKFIFINNRFAQLANDQANIIQGYDTTKDIVYYDANEMITNYLECYELNLDDVEPETQKAMIKMLQIDLHTDNNDLMQLLEKAKEIDTLKQEKLVRKQKI